MACSSCYYCCCGVKAECTVTRLTRRVNVIADGRSRVVRPCGARASAWCGCGRGSRSTPRPNATNPRGRGSAFTGARKAARRRGRHRWGRRASRLRPKHVGQQQQQRDNREEVQKRKREFAVHTSSLENDGTRRAERRTPPRRLRAGPRQPEGDNPRQGANKSRDAAGDEDQP